MSVGCTILIVWILLELGVMLVWLVRRAAVAEGRQMHIMARESWITRKRSAMPPAVTHNRCEVCGRMGHTADMVGMNEISWVALNGGARDWYGRIPNVHIHQACMKKQYAPKMGQVGWQRKPEKKGGKR